jgi:hypothetical protein
VLAILGSSWLAYRIRKIKLSRRQHVGLANIPLCSMILLSLLLTLLIIPPISVQARWNIINHIDVLCIGDEEFMAHQDWITNAKNVIVLGSGVLVFLVYGHNWLSETRQICPFTGG